jgi:serine protease Do
VTTCWILAALAAPPTDAFDKVVKLYGAELGRIGGYGTGVLVSPDGRILTGFSAMLQGESVTAVLSDGRRRPAKTVAVDPRLGVALLQIEGRKLPYFETSSAPEVAVGDVVYALSNQFSIAAGDEPVSVQRGVVSARTSLAGRLGIRDTLEIADAIVLDAPANNPGAAGGAVVDAQGRFVGLLGRELKSPTTQTWIHYALAARALKTFVATAAPSPPRPDDKPPERPSTLRGVLLLPDLLDRTPPFVDGVEPGSLAEAAGLRADDLIVLADGVSVGSARDFRAAVARTPRDKPIRLVVRRAGELTSATLPPEAPAP